MEAIRNQFILAAIFLLLLFCSSNAAAASSKLVDEICGSTYNPHLDYRVCVAALAINPAYAKANLKSLGGIAIQLGMNNFTDSVKFTNQLLKKATARNMINALQSCSGAYSGAAGSFSSAYRELDEDPLTANYDVNFAAYTVKSCEDAMNTNKVKIPELLVRNNYVYIYSSIANVITERLSKQI